MTGIAWIREYYGVPAKRGMRVEYAGHGATRTGTVTGAYGSLLRIRMDGDQRSTLFHPTWRLRYLDSAPRAEGGVQ